MEFSCDEFDETLLEVGGRNESLHSGAFEMQEPAYLRLVSQTMTLLSPGVFLGRFQRKLITVAWPAGYCGTAVAKGEEGGERNWL